MKYKPCQMCGKRMSLGPRQLHQKFCAACAHQRDHEGRRRQKAKLKEARASVEHRTTTCKECGETFIRPAGRAGGAAKRCERCRSQSSRRTLPATRPCDRCGTKIQVPPYATRLRYCPSCRVEVTREQDRKAKAKVRQKPERILTCQRCGTEFKKTNYGRDPRTCPDCRNEDYESRRKPRTVTTEQRYAWKMVRAYSITIEDRDAMADRQGHRCALCNTPEADRRLHLDHDHACCPASGTSCGKCIRGLICRACNNALGLIGDDIETLQRMVKYLQSGGAPRSPNRKRLRD